MDKALVYGTRDSGFDPQQSHFCIPIVPILCPRIPQYGDSLAVRMLTFGSDCLLRISDRAILLLVLK
nr:hypothetical protein Iba_chr03bCG8630 [Ipomoea batatas]